MIPLVVTAPCDASTCDAMMLWAALYIMGFFAVIFGVLRVAIYLLKLNHGRHSN
jgi:hypothetical protein